MPLLTAGQAHNLFSPAAAKAPKPAAGIWSAASDPIVGAGPPGSGLHQTKSGRYVNDIGAYVGGKGGSGVPGTKQNGNVGAGSPLNPLRARTTAPRVKVPASVSGLAKVPATFSFGPQKKAPTSLPPTTDKTKTEDTAPTDTVTSSVQPGGAAATTQVPNFAPTLPGSATLDATAIPNLDPYNGQSPASVVAAMLAPQYTALNQTSTAEQAALKGFATAIIAQLQGQPAAVSNDYTQAQNVTNGLATTAAAQLAAANPNSSVQSLLQSIGAPQAQQDQVSTQLNNAFNGGAAVLNDTQGANAGSALAAQKAAALTFTNGLAGVQGLAATNAEHNLLYQISQQKDAIGAQAPTLQNQVATTEATARGNEYQDKFAQSQAIASNALAKAGYYQNGAALAASYGEKVGAANTKAAPMPDATLSKAYGYAVDQYGDAIPKADGSVNVLPGYKLTKDGTVAKVGSTTSKPKTLTPQEVQKNTGTIYNGVSNMQAGFTDAKGASHPAVDRTTAISTLVKEGYFSSPELSRISTDALNLYYGIPKTLNIGGFKVITVPGDPPLSSR